MSLKLCVRDRGFLYINTHYRFKAVEENAKKMTLRKYKGAAHASVKKQEE